MALQFGTVTGRVVASAGDTTDPGDEPDLVPVIGRIILTPEIPYFVDGTADVIVTKRETICDLDEQGRITSPGDPAQKNVKLVAVDSAGINPQNWLYRATWDLAPGQATLPSFTFPVLAGVTVDISSLIDIPAVSPPTSIEEMEALVIRAEAAAVAAQAAAEQVLEYIANPTSMLGTPLEHRTLSSTGLAYAGRPVTERPVHWMAVRGTDGNYVSPPMEPGTTSSGTGVVPGLDSIEVGEDVETG